MKMIMANKEMLKAKDLTLELVEQKEIHPKLEALKHILVEQFDSKPNSKVIVFNNYRGNIQAMEKYLEKIESIKPKRFVGQANKANDKGLTQKDQVQIIEDLKKSGNLVKAEPITHVVNTHERCGTGDRTQRLEDRWDSVNGAVVRADSMAQSRPRGRPRTPKKRRCLPVPGQSKSLCRPS